MNDTKSAIVSTSVWGSLLAITGALAPTVLTILGFNPVDQQAAVTTVSQIAAGIGGAIALYGRLTATKKIGSIAGSSTQG